MRVIISSTLYDNPAPIPDIFSIISSIFILLIDEILFNIAGLLGFTCGISPNPHR
jgi:hypothetical protein